MERGVPIGVPLGSVFGTLLLVLYIDDLPEENNMKLYADDSSILAIVDIAVKRKGLKKDSDSISGWMREDEIEHF